MCGWTELHGAALSGAVERVRELLERGHDTRARDDCGATPIILALDADREAAARLLVDADPGNNIPDRSGRTPVHLSAAGGYVGILKKLVAAGGNVHLRTVGGRTPLECALGREREAAAEFLADIEDPDSDGKTALALATDAGYLGVVKKLLFGGAYPHVRHSGGQHVLQISLRAGREDIAKVILAMCAWKDVAIDYNKMRLRTDEVRLCKQTLSECRAEIRRMRDAKLDGAGVSYYELARKHASRITPRLADEAVRRVSDRNRAAADFPYYIELLTFRLRKARERRALADRCLGCFSVLCPSLPAMTVDIILLCLGEQDMRNLICAVEFRARRYVPVTA